MPIEQAFVYLNKDRSYDDGLLLAATPGGELEIDAKRSEYFVSSLFSNVPIGAGFWVWEGCYPEDTETPNCWRRPTSVELFNIQMGDNPFPPLRTSTPPPLPNTDYKAKAEYFEKQYMALLRNLQDLTEVKADE